MTVCPHCIEGKYAMTQSEAAKVKQAFVVYRSLPKTNEDRIQNDNEDQGTSRLTNLWL